MRRTTRFLAVSVASCLGLPFLPLYLERTMVRAQHGGRVGDLITFGISVRTLLGYVSDYRYMRPEQHPGLVLALNVFLMLVYAVALGLLVDRVREGGNR